MKNRMIGWFRWCSISLGVIAFSLLFAGRVSAQEAKKPAAVFRAGAAASNITPKMGVPLDGTIMQIGPAKHVHDELHARCLVLDDGKTRLALVVVDNTMVSQEVYDRAKAEITKHTGMSADHICISATHSHSTPRAVVDLVDDDLHREYLDFLASRIADGVRRAINNLAPAEVGWGSFQEPRYVHNRRWFVQEHLQSKGVNPFGESGEKVRMNPGREGLDKPAGPVDTEVFALSVRHTDGRPLALLGNYGLHYIGGIPGGTVSADYFGVFADRTQELLKADRLQPPFVGIMSNGTSGDVNANDMSVPPQKFPTYERMTIVGNDLAAGAVKVAESATYQGGKAIALAAASASLELKVRKPTEKRIAWAEKMKAPPEQKGRLSRPQIYAREVQFLKAYPETVSIPIQVFQIGELAIAQVPCETFAETGLAIKEASPFKSTFSIELANGFFGYLPPPEQFDWGGYETWPARSSFLEEQAEVKIRETVLELMATLKAKE